MPRFLILAVFVLLGWATPIHAQEPLFVPAPGSPVAVGTGSGQVVLADVSGDGHLDMLTRHLQSRSVNLQLGDGNGGFAVAPARPIILSYPPGDMELGDVNHDGILDLGIRSGDRDRVDIFLGNGRGRFRLARGSPFMASAAVYTLTKPSLHLVDLNRDGNLDFVTSNGRRNTIATLLGDGRGRFSPGPLTTLAPDQGFYSIAFGDMDGDGHLDLVTASYGTERDLESGRILTQRGDGTGAFQDASEPPLFLPAAPRIATLADVNDDHRLDAIVTHSSRRLSVLLNDGNGVFAPVLASPYMLEAPAFAVVVADVNRDKKVDLLAATVNSRTPPFASSVTVLLGDGRGFVPAPGSPFPVGPGAYNLTLADVNEDGKLDIATSSFEGNAVTMLLGQ